MFYLPCNLAYLVEDLLLLRGKKAKFLRAAALAVAVTCAVGPMSFHGMLHAREKREGLRIQKERDATLQRRMMEERCGSTEQPNGSNHVRINTAVTKYSGSLPYQLAL